MICKCKTTKHWDDPIAINSEDTSMSCLTFCLSDHLQQSDTRGLPSDSHRRLGPEQTRPSTFGVLRDTCTCCPTRCTLDEQMQDTSARRRARRRRWRSSARPPAGRCAPAAAASAAASGPVQHAPDRTRDWITMRVLSSALRLVGLGRAVMPAVAEHPTLDQISSMERSACRTLWQIFSRELVRKHLACLICHRTAKGASRALRGFDARSVAEHRYIGYLGSGI